MANNPYAGWGDEDEENQKKKRLDPDDMLNYRWAGAGAQNIARYLRLAQDPRSLVTSDEELKELAQLGKGMRPYSEPQEEPLVPTADRPSTAPPPTSMGRELTPGEKLARTIGESLPYKQATMVSRTVADYLNPDKPSALNLVLGGKGFIGDVRRTASDFIRSAGQSMPQTAAELGGAIADMVTGNTGKGQDYTLSGNKASQYFNPGGVAQTLGSFVPDLASGVGAFKFAAKSLGKMAARSAAGETAGLVGRVGGWAASGSAQPTALTAFGRAISPAATRIERAAAAAAAAVPAAMNVVPEVVSGRMNAAEGALVTGLSAAAGPFSAGVWGGTVLRNIAGDVAVNTVAQATTEVVPALVPGGAQFDAAQVWKNMTYGAALGTMFGVMNAKPIQGPGDRAVFGAPVTDQGVPVPGQGAGRPAPGPSPFAVPTLVNVVQQTEQRLFGKVTTPDNATLEQLEARMGEISSVDPKELATLRPTPEGGFAPLSDQYRAQRPEDGATQNIVDTERKVYANALAARYKDNPEMLAAVLDLEVKPGEITPENAQQVLASKIENEWLVQPVEGKGIAGVEQRLAAAGIPSVVGVDQSPVAGYQMPQSSLTNQPRLEAAQPVETQPTSILPDDMRRAAASSLIMPESPIPSRVPDLPTLPEGLTPEIVGTRAAGFAPEQQPQTRAVELYRDVARFVDQEKMRLDATKVVSEDVGVPVEQILEPGSVAAKLYEAEQSGLTPEEARAAVTNELAQNPQSERISPDERDQLKAVIGEHDFAKNVARIVRENPEGFTLDPITGEFTSSGWAVAPSKKTEFRVPAAAFSEDIIGDYVTRMQPLLEAGNKIGGWLNEADGRYYLDIVHIADNPTSAAVLARDGQQIGVFHLDDLKYYDTAELLQQQGILDGYETGPELRRVQEEFDRVASGAGILQSDDPAVPDSFAPVAGFGAEPARAKRPRKPRATVKTESADAALELIETSADQRGEPIEYMGAASRPDASVTHDRVDRMSSFVVDNFDQVQDIRILSQDERIAIRESMREQGVVGTINQPKRKKLMGMVQRLEELQNSVFNGMELEVTILPPKTGRNSRWYEKMLASMEGDGSTVESVRNAVHSGRTSFMDGFAQIRPSGEANKYIMKIDLPETFREKLAQDIKAKYNGVRPPADAVVSINESIREKKTRLVRDRVFDDLRETLEEQTSLSKLAADRGIDLPEGMAFEDVSELYAAAGDDGGTTIKDAGYEVDNRSVEKSESLWRSGYPRVLNDAVKFLDKQLKNLGYTATDKIMPVDLEQYVISKTGPGAFRDIGDLYVKNTMLPSVRSILDKEFPAIAYPPGKNNPAGPIKAVFDHNVLADDSFFSERFDALMPRWRTAMESSSNLAEALGLRSPAEAYTWVAWKVAKESSDTKDKVKAAFSRLKRDNPSFTDKRGAEITKLYDDLMQTRDMKLFSKMNNAYVALDDITDYIRVSTGAEAFKTILNANMMRSSESYKLNMRKLLPHHRIASIATAAALVDEGVEQINDDETYFGIPGSTLKQLLGNGEMSTYALAGVGMGFKAGMKVRFKPGSKQGIRAGLTNAARRTVESSAKKANAVRDAVGTGLSTTRESYANMTPQQRSANADMYMATFRPKIKQGTAEYEAIKAQKIANEMHAAVAGWGPRNILDMFRKDKAANTVGWIQRVINDPVLLASKSPFVKEFVVDKMADSRAQTRRIVKEVEAPINDIVPDIIEKYGNNANFWDAVVAINYRMVALEIKEGGLSRAVLDATRNNVISEIKRDYFTDVNGNFIQGMWDDFMSFQMALNPLRKEDLRGLYGKQHGVRSWEIEKHYSELIVRKDRLNEVIGAAQAGYDLQRSKIADLDKSYKELVQQFGREQADEMFAGYKPQRDAEARARDEYRETLRVHKYELDKINKKMENIDTIDLMTDKSMQTFYINRHRNNKSPFVVRVQFDPKSGIPNVRREYESLTDARIGQMEVLRGAVAKLQGNPEAYQKIVDKRKAIGDRLEELEAMEDRTPALDAEYRKVSAEYDALRGLKPIEEMSDAEVFRFASDFEQLGADATIRDMRRRRSVSKGSRAAKDLIENLMASQEMIESQILTRTLTNGALIKPGTNDVDFVPGKGNAALIDYSASGQVQMFQGEDAFSVNDLVDQIDDLIDAPVDRKGLRELIEKNYMYRENTKNVKNQQVETVWIDMVAIRNLVEAHTDPYVPNLAKNNNWMGYYDPDGKWTPKQKADWVVKSIESMISRVHDYNYHTSVRTMIQEANDWLDTWDINNGLREYMIGLQAYNDQQFKGPFLDKLKQFEVGTRRLVSGLTLAINWGSAIGNRIQGASMAVSHGMLNSMTKYGVKKIADDGTVSEIKWMPSEVAARVELARLQEKGDTGWNIVQGYKKGQINISNFMFGMGAIIAPESTLKFLAIQDGYGKSAPSEQGMWARIYELSQAANLQQGGVKGSYTVREGVETKTLTERGMKLMSLTTDFIEKSNNYTSILMAGFDIQNRLGLSEADWRLMNTDQRTNAINVALEPHRQMLDASKRAREVMGEDLLRIEEKIASMEGLPNMDAERLRLQRQVANRKQRMSKLATEPQIILDQTMNIMTMNRGKDQGDWDRISKSQAERFVETMPLGHLAMTMTGPILRSYNSWMALQRIVGQTEGTTSEKLRRAAAPAVGAAILTTLLGARAATVALGGVFLMDVVAIGEMVISHFMEEDGEKLDKISSSQVWENLAVELGEKYGIEPSTARNFVRTFWDGLFKSALDINVNAGAGIWDVTGGGTPGAVIPATGKAVVTGAQNFAQAWSETGTTYDALWALTVGTPTSFQRTAQPLLQSTLPPSSGNFGVVKVDKFGQPIYDKNGQIQQMSALEVGRNIFFGKPWSETRSKLIKYEGGTPLYTEQDRIAWANALGATRYVRFGESTAGALKGKGTAEQANLALFERDADRLQRAITNKYKEYRPKVDEGKNVINQYYRDNPSLPGPDGKMVPFRQILSIVGTSGVKADFEIKGSAPDEVRKSMLSLAEEWGRSRAAAEAVDKFYGGRLAVAQSEDLENSETANEFAMNKLWVRYKNAYRNQMFRQEGRSSIGR